MKTLQSKPITKRKIPQSLNKYVLCNARSLKSLSFMFSCFKNIKVCHREKIQYFKGK